MKILERHAAPVVPVALVNLWGSTFSRIEGGRAMAKPLRRGLFSRVEVVAGPALPAALVTPERLQSAVGTLLHTGAPASAPDPRSLTP
jgi:hypothetical protein